VWGKDDLGADPELLGLKGSPTAVNRIFPPPARQPGQIIPGGDENPARAAEQLVERLIAHVGAG